MIDRFVKEDCNKFLSYLDSKNLIHHVKYKPQLKNIHKIVFSLSLWELYIDKKNENEYIFLTDLRSDISQSIPLALSGYKKPTYLLLRSAIENILKHIYYTDHKIEFFHYKTSKSYQQMEYLYDYCHLHPKIGVLCKSLNLKNKLSNRYSELSSKIHGKTIKKQEFLEYLTKIKFDEMQFKEYCIILQEYGNIFNLLLTKFNEGLFHTHFDASIKKFILDRLDKTYFTLYKKF